MSLVIAIYVREGIVIASDSRLTLNNTQQNGDKQIVQLALGQTDSSYKTFCTNNIGISTFGCADIKGVPLAGYIESFINEDLKGKACQVDRVPSLLLEYFNAITHELDTWFYVAGYKTENEKQIQQIWSIYLKTGEITLVSKPDQQGAVWGGEIDVLSRLISPMWIKKDDGTYVEVPSFDISWNFFTLQDAIDFAVYAIRTTIDSMRFQLRSKSVGGPIDILVIKPDELFWVQKKELHI
jgi:hypothetical protein